MGSESKCQFIALVGGAVESSLLARRSRPFEVSKMQFNVGSQKNAPMFPEENGFHGHAPNCGARHCQWAARPHDGRRLCPSRAF